MAVIVNLGSSGGVKAERENTGWGGGREALR